MGKRRMTKAQKRMRYYDTTKRLGAIHQPSYNNDNKRQMPSYPSAPPPSYASNPYHVTISAPPASGRRFCAPSSSSHHEDVGGKYEDINNIITICDDIPSAVTKEEEDDPISLDNKRLIANSVPSTELEVALAAELDKQVKHNELLSAELDKLRHALSRIQEQQGNEPLPLHSVAAL